MMKGFSAYLRFLLLSGMVVAGFRAYAQPEPVISLQTENNMPFELLWNGNTYKSSPTGSLMLAKVPTGSQSFAITFLGDIPSQHVFTINAGGNPLAYSLRLSIDNSWSLFDLVDLTLIPGQNNATIEPLAATTPGAALTAVSGEKPAVRDAEPAESKRKSPVITAITKIFDKSGSGGIDQVYILTSGARSDTVALFIPVLEELPKAGTQPSSQTEGNPAGDVVNQALQQAYVPARRMRVPYTRYQDTK